MKKYLLILFLAVVTTCAKAAFVIFQSNGAPLFIRGPVLAVGDSITIGVGDVDYVMQMRDTFGLITTAVYKAAGGIGWLTQVGNPLMNLIERGPGDVDAHLGDNPQPILLLFAGTNDIGNSGLTGAQTYAGFQTYITDRINAGWPAARIVVLTMISRTTGDTPNAERVAYNNLLVGGAATYGYRLSRLDLDPHMGCALCFSDPVYYSGGIHPTVVGLQVIANVTGVVR